MTDIDRDVFLLSSPPIQIDGLPCVNFRGAGLSALTAEATWRYYPTPEERAAAGLRIELHRNADGSGEARLVKGPLERPKHLRVIRVRQFNPVDLRRAAVLLMVDFRQKGW